MSASPLLGQQGYQTGWRCCAGRAAVDNGVEIPSQAIASHAAAAAAGTKTAVDGVKGVGTSIKTAGESVANVTRKSSAAGYASPAVGVFAAAGFGSLLLLAL